MAWSQQIPALLVSTAAGIVVTKGGIEGSADAALVRTSLAAPRSRWRWPPVRPRYWRCCQDFRRCRSWCWPGWPVAAHGCATSIRRWRRLRRGGRGGNGVDRTADRRTLCAWTRCGWSWATGCSRWPAATARGLAEQIKVCARAIASEMGFVLPPGAHPGRPIPLPADSYLIRIKEIEAGKGGPQSTMLLAMDPKGSASGLPGETTREPAFGLPALSISPSVKEEALFRGCTVVDPPSVLTTHLTEVVRENMAELLS